MTAGEHDRMTVEDPPCTDAPHCITCADEGIAMRVAESRPDGIAICVDGLRERHAIAIDLIEGGAEPGDTLLVHAGVAIARLGAAR